MQALDTKDQVAEVGTVENNLDIKDKVAKFIQTKAIMNELKEDNKMLLEEIEESFLESGAEELEIPLEDGTTMVLTKQARIKEVLDKDALANELLIAKDEIKTPFDFSMLTAKGKLTPDMVTKHTSTETVIKVKMKKKSSRKGRKRK